MKMIVEFNYYVYWKPLYTRYGNVRTKMGKRKPIGARYEETTGSRAIYTSLSYSVEKDRLEDGKIIIGYKIHGIYYVGMVWTNCLLGRMWL